MSGAAQIYVFGEVLFDCFPDGARVLGGAPFNVAWHLQAFGDRPQFISRIGGDESGREIARAMASWGMDCAGLQYDPDYPTGRVEVSITATEPSYEIVADSAYDFITAAELRGPFPAGILYHAASACATRLPPRLWPLSVGNGECRFFSTSTCALPGGKNLSWRPCCKRPLGRR